MELMIPLSPVTGAGDLNFVGTYSSSSFYTPPTPQHFGKTNGSDDDIGKTNGSDDDNSEFAFCFDGQLETESLFADVLFDGGKIKPLKLLPSSQYQHIVSNSPSPRSPKRKLSKDVFMAPKHKSREYNDHPSVLTKAKKLQDKKSHLTVSNTVSEQTLVKNTSPSLSKCSSNISLNCSPKWKLTNLLTFRGSLLSNGNSINNTNSSASIMKKDMNEWSFRSEDSSNSRGGGACRKKGRVSAHEWHYMKNRAVTEERRKKTFLPYKKSLLGCMDLDDTGVLHFSTGYGVEIRC